MASKIELSNSQGKKVSVVGNDTVATDLNVHYFNTVAELTSAVGTDGDLAIVADLDRGGNFKYDSTAIDNQGTVFGHWVRQYSGAVNVKWFGDKLLESTFKKASDFSQSVEVDVGTYTLDGNTISFVGKKFHSYGAVTINTNTTIIVTNLVP